MAFVTTPLALRTNCSPATSLQRSGFLSQGVRAESKPRLSTVSPQRRATVTPRCSDMGLSFPSKSFDESIRIGVVSTRWNAEYVSVLLEDVKATLKEKGLSDENIVLMQVPGSWEIPMAARLMAAAQKVDAIVTLGVLIKGETEHYEYIAGPVSSGLMDLQLTLTTPIVFGVLCCTSKEQAAARSTGDKSHAKEWALTAIEMAQLRKSQMGGVSAGKKSVGFF